MHHRVVLFTKPAVPGLVKTRLQTDDGSGFGVLTAQQAASLHRAFLRDTVETLSAVCESIAAARFEIAWALDGGHVEEPGFEQYFGFEQEGRDLGQRLLHGLKRGRAGAESTQPAVSVAVGSDHPELDRASVIEAITVVASDSADVAIGPADDGGFYLLAVRQDRLAAGLFDDVRWSTASVLGEVVSRAQRLGLRVHQLPMNYDCDTPTDLKALASRLATGNNDGAAVAAVTKDWLANNGLLPPMNASSEAVTHDSIESLLATLSPREGFETRSEAQTTALGRQFGELMQQSGDSGKGSLILLRGEMGAGKTAFVRGIADGLGVDAGAVQSPTFTLVNEYPDASGAIRLVHCDLYRLEPSEIESAGVFDVLSRDDCVVVVEWSERLATAWPGAVTLRFSRTQQECPESEAETRRVEWLADESERTKWD